MLEVVINYVLMGSCIPRNIQRTVVSDGNVLPENPTTVKDQLLQIWQLTLS